MDSERTPFYLPESVAATGRVIRTCSLTNIEEESSSCPYINAESVLVAIEKEKPQNWVVRDIATLAQIPRAEVGRESSSLSVKYGHS